MPIAFELVTLNDQELIMSNQNPTPANGDNALGYKLELLPRNCPPLVI